MSIGLELYNLESKLEIALDSIDYDRLDSIDSSTLHNLMDWLSKYIELVNNIIEKQKG